MGWIIEVRDPRKRGEDADWKEVERIWYAPMDDVPALLGKYAPGYHVYHEQPDNVFHTGDGVLHWRARYRNWLNEVCFGY